MTKTKKETGDGDLPRRLLKAEEVAELLAVNLWTVYRLVRKGEIPHIRVGKSIRFTPDDIETYIEQHRSTTWERVDKRGRPKTKGKAKKQAKGKKGGQSKKE